MNKIINLRRASGNEIPPSPPWEVQFISYLVALLQAQSERIRRREELDRSLALALNAERRAGRRAA